VKVGVSEERPVKEQTYIVKVEQARNPRIIVKAETSAILAYHCESLNKRESRLLLRSCEQARISRILLNKREPHETLL
jgi:hypothetical protein